MDAGFNVSDGFYNAPEKSRNGTNGKIVFINNPLEIGDKDSVFVYFNNYIIIKNTFKEVYDIVIPTNIKGKYIQTAMLVKHNGIKYFYVYEGYDLFLPLDFESTKPIYFVFTPKNYSKVPYEVYVKWWFIQVLPRLLPYNVSEKMLEVGIINPQKKCWIVIHNSAFQKFNNSLIIMSLLMLALFQLIQTML